MKNLLTLTAIAEAATGLALLTVPALVVRLLLGVEISGVSIPLAHVAGAALLALSLACWLARAELRSRAAYGIVASMLLYNIAVAAVLAQVGLSQGFTGIGLWPVVILHAALAGWCVVCLRPAHLSRTSVNRT